MSNMWKPLIAYTIFQLNWLTIQIKFEFPALIFFSVMVSAFILLILWPSYEKKKFEKVR